ncbi:response regulator [Roseimaritima ulvae]|uniref:Nitrogen assimilation regulatory protein n=1 Tax=Roseimaritima ulvae TaxID=980254 RepID=A0A5B9R5R7_9BACT|nr:response regulator [Roseimaritima ulvae]QEG41881.1 Nitrogen assimilation regulatory protein [Roseimaritima ulvae]
MPQSVASNSPKPFAIVADDVKANRTLVSTWFAELGYDCRPANNGAEAWKLVREHVTELVVTDIDMPVCSGLVLLHSLRNHASADLRRVPVIVMSSMRDREICAFIAAYGGTVFLPKPLEKEAFVRMVHGIHDLKSEYVSDASGAPETPWQGTQRISPTLRRLVREVQYGRALLR